MASNEYVLPTIDTVGNYTDGNTWFSTYNVVTSYNFVAVALAIAGGLAVAAAAVLVVGDPREQEK